MLFLLQAAPTMPYQVAIFDWRMIAAAAINSVLVLIAVQAIKHYLPILKEKAPFLLPLIALMAAPVMGLLTDFLFNMLGYPIDLGPIVAALTGAVAVTMHQIGRQTQKARGK